jgi:hyperosmotically inducible protein
MQKHAKTLSAILLGSLVVFSVGAVAQSSGPVSGSAADNSKTNERDRADTVKPTDQSNAKGDINVAATIRRAIVADRSLSTKAHNVKLVANGGAVTLRGPVDSEAEKAKVEQIAKGVAGVASVENDLDVKISNH